MPDEMFFSNDERSLLRGRRVAARTDTCRPCLVSLHESVSPMIEAVIMDMTPYGMLVRMMEPLPVGSGVSIQMMRDDGFRESFSSPREGTVTRREEVEGGFTDHGVMLINKTIPKASERPVFIEKRPARRKGAPTRMHTIDLTIGGPRRGRKGR